MSSTSISAGRDVGGPVSPAQAEVLYYWLEDGLELGWPSRSLSTLWFGGGATVDGEITRRFGTLVHQALTGALAEWETSPLARLALVLLLDQFTRNVFRGQARAFAGDARAQALVCDTLDQSLDLALPLVARVFMLMPLMHAEHLKCQDRCVHHLEILLATVPPARQSDVTSHLASAQEHRAIIAEFGRFPHRNSALGREDTATEQVYLLAGKRFGQ